MSLEDELSKEYAKRAARKFKSGRYTATQTGAKQFAEERRQRTAEQILRQNIAAGTTAFEQGSVLKDPTQQVKRPTRTKR